MAAFSSCLMSLIDVGFRETYRGYGILSPCTVWAILNSLMASCRYSAASPAVKFALIPAGFRPSFFEKSKTFTRVNLSL